MQKKLKQFQYLSQSKKTRFFEGGLRFNNKNIKRPMFSIITVVFNGEKYLRKTIESVKKQGFKDYEYIVIDGGSTDSSLKIIKEYKNDIDYWVSEKDNGIYDAFNKGMKLAKGEFIGIINSDDIYKPNALKTISKYINANPKIDFIFGSVKKHWGILHGYRPHKIRYSWGFYTSHSTGFFLKRKAAEKVGKYDLRYKYHADYDYLYRLIVKKKLLGMATKKNEVVGIFRRGGFSSTIKFKELFKEEIKIRYNNGQNIFLILIIIVYRGFKHLNKFFK
jgi:glycosyltransferase involved in cell wall biosynthesis